MSQKRAKAFLMCVGSREEVSFPSTEAENHSKQESTVPQSSGGRDWVLQSGNT